MQSMLCLPKEVIRRIVRHFWSFTVLILAVGFPALARGQVGNFEDLLGGSLKPRDSARAAFSAKLVPESAKPGDEVTLQISAKLPPKSYIYATTGDFSQRTKITTKNLVGLRAIDQDFRPDRDPITKLDPIFNLELSKFYDAVTWSKKFRLDAEIDPATVAVDLEMEGQYCSEGPGGECRLLQPPVKLHAALILENDAANSVVANRNEAAPAADKQQEAAPADDMPIYAFTKRPKRGKQSPVELQFELEPKDAVAGKTVNLKITMSLDERWHTFSTTFTGEGGTATKLSIEKLSGLKPVDKAFVPDREPEIKDIPELSLKQEVYHDRITWTRKFEVLPRVKAGEYGIEGSVAYQTCKTSCLPPTTEQFSLGVLKEIEPVEATALPEHTFKPQDKGLVAFMFTAALAALVALLTPCVFPMVPITVSFFLKQSERQGGRPTALAIVFSLSIIAAFVIIGVGVAAIFGATKPNELANHWILNLFLATIFFAFALNMLGLFEIQVPSWLLTLTSTGEQTGGYVGVVFMALTFVLTSFSCTFAFVGSLLATAAKGDYYWPILGMAVFGATFALPFFLLALAPGALKSLPKSGGWLNSVKVVMGFVEIGVAVKYISIVDQQWNPVPWIFDFTNVMTLWSVLSVCTGLYLLGQFRLSHDTPIQGLSPIRVLLAVGFLVLAGLFAIGMVQPDRESWMIDQLVAFAPARIQTQESATALPSNHSFERDFDKAVATATQDNDKPLFIDFTGVFCTNCRLMEKLMNKPQNRQRLDKLLMVQLYTDKVPGVSSEAEAKRLLERNINLQTSWFGDVTLPAYAVVTPDGKTILAKYLGLEARTGEFAEFLDEGLAKWETIRR